MPIIADGVLETWRQRWAESSKASITLVLNSDLDRRRTKGALKDAVRDVLARFDEGDNLPDGYDELRLGVWTVADIPDGVVLQVGEKCDAFGDMLRSLAEDLSERGVGGTLELYEPPAVRPLPRVIEMLECRMRVCGERYHQSWHPDRSALRAVAGLAAKWCAAAPLGPGLQVRVGTLPWRMIQAEEDLDVVVDDATAAMWDVGRFTFATVVPDRVRAVTVEPVAGRVTVVIADDALSDGGWEPAVAELRALMTSASRWLVYGYAKRGSNVMHAIRGISLADDWPAAPHYQATSLSAEAFEDSHAPDAFGLQLLGPLYADRVPRLPAWRQTMLANSRCLLEHVDPTAWFESSFAPRGGVPLGALVDAPSGLGRARSELREILFSQDLSMSQRRDT